MLTADGATADRIKENMGKMSAHHDGASLLSGKQLSKFLFNTWNLKSFDLINADAVDSDSPSITGIIDTKLSLEYSFWNQHY